MELSLPTERILARKEGAVGWLVFNNPARRNALSVDMREAIPVVLDTFNRDPEVRVVVMTGAGDQAFVSGADISEFEKRRADPEAIKAYDELSKKVERAFIALDKPLIAMIRGFCMGGGLLTALRADLRIASEDARFGVPAVRLGLGYALPGVRALVETVGFPAATEILLTGGRFPAADALRWGLVQRVVPAGELEPTVRKLAETVAGNAPLTIRAIRGALSELHRDPEKRDIAKVEALVAACFASDDYKEGRKAFLEKRRPDFKGR